MRNCFHQYSQCFDSWLKIHAYNWDAGGYQDKIWEGMKHLKIFSMTRQVYFEKQNILAYDRYLLNTGLSEFIIYDFEGFSVTVSKFRVASYMLVP